MLGFRYGLLESAIAEPLRRCFGSIVSKNKDCRRRCYAYQNRLMEGTGHSIAAESQQVIVFLLEVGLAVPAEVVCVYLGRPQT